MCGSGRAGSSAERQSFSSVTKKQSSCLGLGCALNAAAQPVDTWTLMRPFRQLLKISLLAFQGKAFCFSEHHLLHCGVTYVQLFRGDKQIRVGPSFFPLNSAFLCEKVHFLSHASLEIGSEFLVSFEHFILQRTALISIQISQKNSLQP